MARTGSAADSAWALAVRGTERLSRYHSASVSASRISSKLRAVPRVASRIVVMIAVAVTGMSWLIRQATSNAVFCRASRRAAGSVAVSPSRGPRNELSETGSPKRT